MTDLLRYNIDVKTEAGQVAEEALLRGELVGEELLMRMLRVKMEAPECSHYGYVIDGLPCAAGPLADPHAQLEIIRAAELQPDFVVHIRVCFALPTYKKIRFSINLSSLCMYMYSIVSLNIGMQVTYTYIFVHLHFNDPI